MNAYYDCLNSISFVNLILRYRALEKGYLNGNPYRKLSALKGMIQDASPCLDKRRNNCMACPILREVDLQRGAFALAPSPLPWRGTARRKRHYPGSGQVQGAPIG